MNRSKFRFDPTTHEYYIGAVRFPSVTEICAAADETERRRHFTAESRHRGQDCHAMWLAIDMGAWDDDRKVYAGYGEAYRAYLRYAQPRWLELEQPRVNRKLGFSGTRDRLGIIGGWVTNVDLKSGVVAEQDGMQLAGYDLLDGKPDMRRRRVNVYLRRNGTFRIVERTDPDDYVKFMRNLRKVQRGPLVSAAYRSRYL